MYFCGTSLGHRSTTRCPTAFFSLHRLSQMGKNQRSTTDNKVRLGYTTNHESSLPFPEYWHSQKLGWKQIFLGCKWRELREWGERKWRNWLAGCSHNLMKHRWHDRERSAVQIQFKRSWEFQEINMSPCIQKSMGGCIFLIKIAYENQPTNSLTNITETTYKTQRFWRTAHVKWRGGIILL